MAYDQAENRRKIRLIFHTGGASPRLRKPSAFAYIELTRLPRFGALSRLQSVMYRAGILRLTLDDWHAGRSRSYFYADGNS
jgi:hypothetical protein